MEKQIVVLSSVLIFAAFLHFSAVIGHPRPHPNHAQMEECKTAESATDADMRTLRGPGEPTKAAKCMLACLGEKTGKIVNGTLVADGVVNWFKNSPDYSEQMLQAVNEVVAECKNIKNSDRCEYGYSIMECMKEGAEKRGFKPPMKGPGPRN